MKENEFGFGSSSEQEDNQGHDGDYSQLTGEISTEVIDDTASSSLLRALQAF